jgi:hypothetical protein
VVNKVGDIKAFLCCGYRLTAAQWSAPRSPLKPHALAPVARAIAAHGRAFFFSQFGGSTSSA